MNFFNRKEGLTILLKVSSSKSSSANDEGSTHLKVDDLARVGGPWRLLDLGHVHSVFLDLHLDVAQLAFHLVAATHLVHELTLERIHVWVQLELRNGFSFVQFCI